MQYIFKANSRTKLNNLSASIDQYRAQASARHPENFGFVTLDSVHAAHAAAYDLKGEHPKGLTIKLAPNHKDIVRQPIVNWSSFLILMTENPRPDMEEHWAIQEGTSIQENYRIYSTVALLFTESRAAIPNCVLGQPKRSKSTLAIPGI